MLAENNPDPVHTTIPPAIPVLALERAFLRGLAERKFVPLRDKLNQLRHKLSTMNITGLYDFYRAA
jgi:hypothetical protein